MGLVMAACALSNSGKYSRHEYTVGAVISFFFIKKGNKMKNIIPTNSFFTRANSDGMMR